MERIVEKAREIPVIEDADICVLGGSATGVFAAVRASRLGARAVLVERGNCFGGTAAAGLVNIWHSLYDTENKQQIIGGLTHEVVEALRTRDAVLQSQGRFDALRLNTEELKIELDVLVKQAGVKPYLHTMYTAPLRDEDNGELRGVFVENKDGRGVIKARYFVDATGDGDLCRDMGFAHYSEEHLQPPTACAKIQGMGSIPRERFIELLQSHGGDYDLPEDWGWSSVVPNSPDVWMHAETHVFGADCSRASDLTFAEMEGRRQVRAMMDLMRDHVQDAPPLTLLGLPSAIGIRETRRFHADFRITQEDVLHGRRYDDAIANGTYRVDIHHSDGPGITFRYLDGSEVVFRNRIDKTVGRWREPVDEDPTFYQIPFRSLLPKGTRNVVMAGRILDTDQGAFGALRVMVNMNQTGEAAGVASYLALQQDKAVTAVAAGQLRAVLAEGGSIVL